MVLKIPKFTNTITINTGNIISKYELFRKMHKNLFEEILDALNLILNSWNDIEIVSNQNHLTISNNDEECSLKVLKSFQRSDLKITIKLFLFSNDNEEANYRNFDESIVESVHEALKTTNMDTIDNLILDFGQIFVNLDAQFQKTWTAIEKLILEQKVINIGLSNVDEQMFQKVFEWAFIKPHIIQINASTCCKVSPWFKDFCRIHKIQLLTHSDHNAILPSESINEPLFDNTFATKWVLRYQAHIKCRGVVITKGYLVRFSK